MEFLGYRKDIANLMMLSDLSVSSSRREGLPLNVMEAMATGLALIVTDCRGNRDFVVDGVNGFVTAIDDVEAFTERVLMLYESSNLRKECGQRNLSIVEKYSLKNIGHQMAEIYTNYIG
ncbi:glycosyltransferase [Bacillus sp. FJAT-29790]|uniref:glycosyltransferase n=1 Tax=Bacillus sp. FJAT-29790 TaxID=1895002 RepID=UPI001C244B1B|nr:glycosyltransferase [Bacillus sp. FJAT-29790]